MNYIDEPLKEIFEKNKITDFVSAYSYLMVTGCYKPLECISNALYYFNISYINQYDVLKVTINGTFVDCCFGKLIELPHLRSYLEYRLKKAKDENEALGSYYNGSDISGLFNELVTVHNVPIDDYLYLKNNYGGLIITVVNNVPF